MTMPLIQSSIFSNTSYNFQSFHVKGPPEAPSSFTAFPHHGTALQLQLVPLQGRDKIPSKNFLGNLKATFLTLLYESSKAGKQLLKGHTHTHKSSLPSIQPLDATSPQLSRKKKLKKNQPHEEIQNGKFRL